MRLLGKLLVVAVAVSGAAAHAQSIAKPGHMCSYEMVTPSLDCINPDPGADVRLYVQEFQSCDDKGNITALDKSVMALNAISDKYGGINTPQEQDISILYSPNRIHIDDRGGDLTFNMPTSAVVTDKEANQTIKFTITDKRELDYEGADSYMWHFVGTFQKLNSKGKVIASGRISCGLID